MAVPGDIFVGREREMAELTSALDDALSGRGRVVMLVGEPGIGKTRLAEELAAAARGRGAEVLWGRCPEQPGAPPFWPWVQVMRALASRLDDAELHATTGAGAADLAGAFPELRDRFPGLPEAAPGPDAESARFRLFDSVTSFLKRAAGRTPLVVVLDNLHWADGSSLRLLEFMAPEAAGAAVLVLGTYRDTELSRRHPLAETLGNLTRERHFVRIALRGLAPGDVRGLLEATLGTSPSPELAAAVYSRTEGNSLFAHEVARLLRHDALSVSPHGPSDMGLRIPEGVREVIGQRLNRLSTQANEVLPAASVIGRDFGLDTLADVTEGLTDDTLLAALEEAVRARLVDEDPRLPGRYRFSHALVRQTLYEELSTTRRVRLHARIAQALERSYGVAAGDHAAELAHHFGEAEAVLGPDGLVKHSLAAGQGALAAHAYEEAQAHFDRALRAHGERGDLTEAALQEGLGRSQEAWGSSLAAASEVSRHMKRAFEIYMGAGQTSRAVDVAIQPGSGRDRYMTDQLARALEVAAPGSREAGLLLSRYGVSLVGTSDGLSKAIEAVGQALSIGRRLGDAEVEAWALTRSAAVDSGELQWQSAFDSALKAIDAARRAGSVSAEAFAIYVAARAAFDLGLTAQAMDLERSACDLAAKTRNRLRLHQLADVSATLALLLGRWETARTAIGSILQLQPPGLAHITDRLYLEYATGRHEAFEEQMSWLRQRLKSDPPPAMQISSVYATVLLCAADDDGLRSLVLAAEPGLRLSSENQWDTSARLLRAASIGIIAVASDDPEAAAAVYPELKAKRASGARLAGSTSMGVGPGWTSVDRVLGAVADTIGDRSAAMIHFEDAVAFCRRASYRPELAQTCHDYAALLLNERGAAGVSKARDLVTEGLAITTELGMKSVHAKLEKLAERLAIRRGGRPEFPDGLTEREVEVLRLVAAGKSNREISDALVISENTATTHVKNILSKISVANRTEAAAYAYRHGLVAPPPGTSR